MRFYMIRRAYLMLAGNVVASARAFNDGSGVCRLVLAGNHDLSVARRH